MLLTALQNLFTTNPRPHDTPLFCDHAGTLLSRDLLISTLKECLASLSFDALQFFGHSFRRGAASAAAAVGYAYHEIQLLGRWCSDTYKLYIDVPCEHILSLSAHLHLAAPRAHNFIPLALPFAPAPLA